MIQYYKTNFSMSIVMKKICNVIDNIPTKKLPCLEEGTISTNCFTLQLNEEFQILNPKEKFELLNALRQKNILF